MALLWNFPDPARIDGDAAVDRQPCHLEQALNDLVVHLQRRVEALVGSVLAECAATDGEP
jgi:hypothetical protein